MAVNKNRYLFDEIRDDEVEFDERDSEKEEENSYTFWRNLNDFYETVIQSKLDIMYHSFC